MFFRKKDLNVLDDLLEDFEYDEKQLDEKYNYPILRSEAFKIAIRNQNLKSDFCRNDKRDISYLSFDKWDIDIKKIDDNTYWKVQILKGDISWIKNENKCTTNFDGFLVEKDLKKLCCLINVETGEYKYFPKGYGDKMIDTHYDLLSIAYVAYLKNDYSYLKEISKYFNKDNVTGVIANLYFMSIEEMQNELHPNYYREEISVLEMFVKAKEILDKFLPNTEILYSIEGADYIRGCSELEQLYSEGLNSLIIAWNTKSKYASGNRSNQGLTKEGKELLSKAIDLGMCVDFSHANKETFTDMIQLVKEKKNEGIDVITFASHSNSRSLCGVSRNLTDEQLEMLSEIGGLVGVFSNRNFVVSENERKNASFYLKENMYLKHIEHIKKIIGEDNIMLATDDMNFCKEADKEYGEVAIYDYRDLKKLVSQTLSKNYTNGVIDKFIYSNAYEKIFKKIKKNISIRNKKR